MEIINREIKEDLSEGKIKKTITTTFRIYNDYILRVEDDGNEEKTVTIKYREMSLSYITLPVKVFRALLKAKEELLIFLHDDYEGEEIIKTKSKKAFNTAIENLEIPKDA